MLQKLRDKSSGWIATVVLGLLVVPFAFFGLEQYSGQSTATYAAKLESPPKWWPSAPHFWPVSMLWQSETIEADEFRTVFEQQRQQQRDAQGVQFDARAFESADNKRKVLDTLVDRRVLRMAAVRDGIVIGDGQVRDSIQAIPAFQADGKFNAQSYQLALASQNQTPRQFEQIVRDDLQQTVMARGVADSAFVTKSELERLLRLFAERRAVGYAVMPAPATDTAAVADAEIQRWYQQHAARYRAPESVTLEYLDIDGSKLPVVAAASEDDLRKRYQQEQAKFGSGEQRVVSHILIKAGADAASQKVALGKATRLAAQAKAPGADFAALARANSDDAGSKAAGGDLGAMQKNGAMVKPFEDAVFAMQAPGIVGPVKTTFGYHVIQLRQITAGQQKPFEEVRDQLAAEQVDTDRERSFNETLGKLVDEVYKNPTTLAGAARLGALPMQTLADVTRIPSAARVTDPIAANPAVLRAAFSESLIQDGTVSDPVEISPTRSVLLRVSAHQPERALPLPQVRDGVIAAIRADRTRKAVIAAADAMLAQVRAGKALSAVAAQRNLAFTDMPILERGQPAPDPTVSEAIFALPAPAAGKVAAGKQAMADGSMVVFAVSKVTPGDASKATPEQRQSLRQQLAQLDGSSDALALVRALRRHMRVDVVEDRL